MVGGGTTIGQRKEFDVDAEVDFISELVCCIGNSFFDALTFRLDETLLH